VTNRDKREREEGRKGEGGRERERVGGWEGGRERGGRERERVGGRERERANPDNISRTVARWGSPPRTSTEAPVRPLTLVA
jgi:hypothetical protein